LKQNAIQLRQRLKRVGLSDLAVNAAWPTWWSDDADASSSAQAELRFSIARKLGLDPHSLLEDDEEPRFIWRDEAKFKHLSGEGDLERSAITSFGAALGSILVAATQTWTPVADTSSIDLRNVILQNQPYVRLLDLLSICWSVGVPIVHLRVFPWPRKRMAAMAVRVDLRHAILLGKDSLYPPHIAFYVAHELAHIALRHLARQSIVVDLEDFALTSPDTDPEEAAADAFALSLLTGEPSPRVLSVSHRVGARGLADAALRASDDLRIEPGTLALCFGYSTGKWAIANASMRYIYSSRKPVWSEVNKVASLQLSLDHVPEDTRSYLQSVLGQRNRA
jgi:hypothetical protein